MGNKNDPPTIFHLRFVKLSVIRNVFLYRLTPLY